MGFSLKKAVKSVTKAVSAPIASVGKAVEKIAQGKVAEGLGDIGQTGLRTGLDTVTAGNKSLVDSYSGGLLTSAEQAARGNTKDATRVGVVGGATFFGGPMAGFAANNVFANGGNFAQAALAAGSGGEMGFLSDINGFLGNNPALSQLANNVISGLGPKSAPKVVQQAPAVQTVEVARKGMSMGAMIGIGAGVIAVALLAVVMLRKKGK